MNKSKEVKRDIKINPASYSFNMNNSPRHSSNVSLSLQMLNKPDPAVLCTIFLHVFPASVAKHLWCRWCCYHPIAVDHDLHVLVHGTGSVHVLHIENSYDSTEYNFTLNFTFKSTHSNSLKHQGIRGLCKVTK